MADTASHSSIGFPTKKAFHPPNKRSSFWMWRRGWTIWLPQLRDVLRARFIQGESSAEIARRYGCTEQTISGRIRRGLSDMRRYFEDVHSA